MRSDKLSIWVLSDDRPGNVTQSFGVAEALGLPYTIKHIRNSVWAKLPNRLLGCSLLGVDRDASDAITPPWPDIVIAAGRRLVPLLRHIKRQHPTCFTLYLMEPEVAPSAIDLIAIPEHDAPSPHPNIMTTVGTPHRVTRAMLDEQAAQWRDRLASLPSPHIALLVGGDSPSSHFSDDDWQHLAQETNRLAQEQGGSLLITTSRRTGERGEAILREHITVPHHFHQWQADAQENPYLAFLGLADAVVVTGESMSMCSESCATGMPVCIFTTKDSSSRKHKRLHEALYTRGFAHPLNGDEHLYWQPPAQALDEAGRVANAIRKRLHLTG